MFDTDPEYLSEPIHLRCLAVSHCVALNAPVSGLRAFREIYIDNRLLFARGVFLSASDRPVGPCDVIQLVPASFGRGKTPALGIELTVIRKRRRGIGESC